MRTTSSPWWREPMTILDYITNTQYITMHMQHVHCNKLCSRCFGNALYGINRCCSLGVCLASENRLNELCGAHGATIPPKAVLAHPSRRGITKVDLAGAWRSGRNGIPFVLHPVSEQCIGGICWEGQVLQLNALGRVASVGDDRCSTGQDGGGTRPHTLGVVPLVRLQGDGEMRPLPGRSKKNESKTPSEAPSMVQPEPFQLDASRSAGILALIRSVETA